MRLLLSLCIFLAACATGPETGTFAFRADPTCDGMGAVTLYLDDVSQGRFTLGDGGVQIFEVASGFHSGRAQEMQDRLLEFTELGGEVRSDQPVTYLMLCPPHR